ncbi:MAG TPA: hypothetical protein VIQ80_01610 [Candidatus Saccharimonadales bacterium]
MNFTRVKVSTTVPLENADAVREALGKAGAGIVGNYSFCSFAIIGTGRFMPNDQANPHIGKANMLETVEEERIEVACDRDVAKRVVAALRQAHPYEEPIVNIVPLIDEDQL